MRHVLTTLAFAALAAASPAQEILDQQRRDEARRRYRAGEEFMISEAFEDAAREFKAATEADPGFVLAHYGAGPGAHGAQALSRGHRGVHRLPRRDPAGGLARPARQADMDQRRDDEIHELGDSLGASLGQVKGATRPADRPRGAHQPAEDNQPRREHGAPGFPPSSRWRWAAPTSGRRSCSRPSGSTAPRSRSTPRSARPTTTSPSST